MTPLLRRVPALLVPLAAFLAALPSSLPAQDNVRGGREPVVASIDPAKLTYDILVDGSLAQDDAAAKKFKTIQAAYAAAPAGTEQKPTVIGLKPGVYQIPGGGNATGLNITKNWITFLGLTNNRRTVVLADNRGNKENGPNDVNGNGFVVMINATGFTAKNLTFLNYCNVDYEYPGDPSKNLTKRSPVITQAVAMQAQGDKHVYENVALLSRLDTMFLRTTRSYFKNVYIEGTDDWMGGGQVAVWEDCTLVYPTGRGVFSASNVFFFHCKFEAARGFAFYKAEFRGAERPDVLIECTLPVSTPESPVSWVRGPAAPRPAVYSLTYHNKDTSGKPAVIQDCNVGSTPTFTYSREMSDQERAAFNPWNLLRAPLDGKPDDWDPAGVREKYESAGQGSLPFRMALSGATPSIRTGGAGAKIGATVVPARATDQQITWSTISKLVTLSSTTGGSITVTGNNTGEPVWVPINATAPNGLGVTAWAYVEPRYIEAPKFTREPKVQAPAQGKVSVDYALDLGGRPDQSVVSWSICDDASGARAREIAVSRGLVPYRTLTLGTGEVGKYLKVSVQPKHNISDPGAAVTAIASQPIAASDIPSPNLSLDVPHFVPATNDTYANGLWTVLGTWTNEAGDHFAHGYGLRVGSQGAQLLYQQDAKCGDMQVELTMTPEKTEGMAFGSPGAPTDEPRAQKADIYIKYDPRTRNGYALRFWRTTQYAGKCVYQLYKIVNGAGSPLDDKQAVSGVFKPSMHLTLKVTGTRLSVEAHNDTNEETLELAGTIAPNDFGGAGVMWNGTVPRGNSCFYSQFDITYPQGVTVAKR